MRAYLRLVCLVFPEFPVLDYECDLVHFLRVDKCALPSFNHLTLFFLRLLVLVLFLSKLLGQSALVRGLLVFLLLDS